MIELLKYQILELERLFETTGVPDAARIAVFDLDNTMLVGDIGDAVFAQLAFEGHPLSLTWSEYQRVLRSHRSKAYADVVKAMAGTEPAIVVRATELLLERGKKSIKFPLDLVQRPIPRPLFVEFISFLREQHYQIYVLSASNHISVQLVAERWFQIPPSHSFGIQARIRDGKLTSDLIEPLPVGNGKALLFRHLVPLFSPIITATDSRIDLPLLRLTHPLGFSLWVGDNRSDFQTVTDLVGTKQRFFLVDGNESFAVEEY